MKKLLTLLLFTIAAIQLIGCGRFEPTIEITGPSAVRVGEANKIQLKATLTLEDQVTGDEYTTEDGLKWSSSDETVATVDRNGSVEGLTAGEVVTITVSKKNAEASIAVRVIEPYEILVHYVRYAPDGTEEGDQYINWGLHLWWNDAPGNAGNWTRNYFEQADANNNNVRREVQWTTPLLPEGEDDFGRFFLMDDDIMYDHLFNNPNNDPLEYPTDFNLKLITHEAGNKDGGDRPFPNLREHYEFWLIQGVGEIFTSRPNTNIQAARLAGENTIEVEFLETESLSIDQFTLTDNVGEAVAIDAFNVVDETNATLTASVTIYGAPYTISYKGREVLAGVNAATLDADFAYDGELGCKLVGDSAELKLWAPLATSVTAYFYNKADQTVEVGSIALTRGDKGVWALSVAPADLGLTESLEGYYYQYEVVNNGEARRVLDPYAKSMAEVDIQSNGAAGASGDIVGKAAIIDPSSSEKTVSGYANIPGYTKREDAIIYEVHIRDFTSGLKIADSSVENFGTYTAFIEKLPYLQSLGITHIQLMPMQASYYGDESQNKNIEDVYDSRDANYNWGYDPHSYFTPDGMYSSNPKDAMKRINEFKELVEAIHNADMAVTLDVVYNHTARAEILNDIVPGYYYRLNADGSYIAQSACGNDTASEHTMMRKIIIDSILYWVDEFKVDGFRFDLMGIMDRVTVAEAYKQAKVLNPNVHFVGEGWYMYPGDIMADQGWQLSNNDEFGDEIVSMFNDDLRDMLKGGGMSEDNVGFIENEAIPVPMLFSNIKGQVFQELSRMVGDPTNTPFTTDDPGDCLQYIAAHDGLTLHDKMAYNLGLNPNPDPNAADYAAQLEQQKEIFKRAKLGNFFILTSQGIAFLHAGQEYGRTKEFKVGTPEGDFISNATHTYVNNSYDSSDIVNQIDWSLVDPNGSNNAENLGLLEYTKGLIALRKSTDAFRLGEQALVNANVTLMDTSDIAGIDVTAADILANFQADNTYQPTADLAIAYKATATTGENYYVIVNADSTSRTFTFTENIDGGVVVVDNDEANPAGVSAVTGAAITGSTITVDALTAIIIKK